MTPLAKVAAVIVGVIFLGGLWIAFEMWNAPEGQEIRGRGFVQTGPTRLQRVRAWFERRRNRG